MPIQNIEKVLRAADIKHVSHPRECIDFIAVSDLAAWQLCKLTFIGPNLLKFDEAMKKIYGESGCATTTYIRHAIGSERQKEYFAPIGMLLSGLFSRLAWYFPDMRRLEEYFRKVNMLGSGEGEGRRWPIEIYSERVRQRVSAGHLTNGMSYDEWSMHF